MFNFHLSRFSKLQVHFFYFQNICFIESKPKVGETLDFSTFLDVAKQKCIYVLSNFIFKVIIYQAFKCKNIFEHILANMFQKYFSPIFIIQNSLKLCI